MDYILGFVSLTGDTEKSDLLVNIAASLARCEKRVLLVDLAFPVPALDLLCGVAEERVYTAADVGAGRVALSRAVLPVSLKKGRTVLKDRLSVLAGSPLEALTADELRSLLAAVRGATEYDLAIVSFSGEPLTREGLDALFLLTGTDEASLRSAEARAPLMNADAFLLTGYPTDWDSLCELPLPAAIVERLGIPVFGIVPCSPTGLTGILEGCARSRSYLCAVRNVSNRILGTSVPLLTGVSFFGIGRRRILAKAK